MSVMRGDGYITHDHNLVIDQIAVCILKPPAGGAVSTR